jgi:hypothetical protein
MRFEPLEVLETPPGVDSFLVYSPKIADEDL